MTFLLKPITDEMLMQLIDIMVNTSIVMIVFICLVYTLQFMHKE